MPKPRLAHCCKCNAKNTDDYYHCNKCVELIELTYTNYPELNSKARKLIEAQVENIIDLNCYIKKRDRLLHLQKITKDKYLTKLKKEVDDI